jgi:hypothetical protein
MLQAMGGQQRLHVAPTVFDDINMNPLASKGGLRSSVPSPTVVTMLAGSPSAGWRGATIGER